jgi:hypothetical protein
MVKNADTVKLIKPSLDNIRFAGKPSSMISSVGMIDGKLHIQTWTDRERLGAHININLLDAWGNVIEEDEWYSFELDERGNFAPDSGRSGYSEYVFDIGPDELPQYSLIADFTEAEHIHGDWSVTFKADDGAKSLEAECGIAVNGITLNHMTVNPFGIRFSASGEEGFDFDGIVFGGELSVTVSTDAEDIDLPVRKAEYDWKNDVIYISCDAQTPIDTGTVKSVTVNGVTVIPE